MPVNAVQPINTIRGTVGQLISCPFQAVGGLGLGVGDAIKLYAKPELELSKLSLAAQTDDGVFIFGKFSQNLFRFIVRDVLGRGAALLKQTGFHSAVLNAFKSQEGFRKLLDLFTTMEKNGIGWRGGAALGGYFGLAATGLILGTKLALNAWHKTSEVKKGFFPDNERSALVHGIHSALGFSTAIGAIAMFANPTIGIPIVVAGFFASKSMDLLKWLRNGLHWFNRPNLAPYPFNNLIRGNINPDIMNPV